MWWCRLVAGWILSATVACGRVGFDANSPGGGDAGGDSSGTPPSGLFVQGNGGQGTGTQIAVPFTASQRAGDLDFIAVRWAGTATAQVSDTRGNSYLPLHGGMTINGETMQPFYSANIAGGANTITVQFSASVTKTALRIAEYQRIGTLDTGVAFVTTSGPVVSFSGQVTTNNAHDLLIAVNHTLAPSSTAQPPLIQRVAAGDAVLADLEVMSAGTYTTTFMQSQPALGAIYVGAFVVP